MDVTPENVRESLGRNQYSVAMMMAFRLNEHKLILEVVEKIPAADSEFLFRLYLYDSSGDYGHFLFESSNLTVQ